VEVTPILNVSDLQASFEWFAKLGWEKGWDWGPPDADSPTFGAVKADDHEIFLCVDGQGGRGEHGVWLSLWLDDVDAVYATCAREGFDVIRSGEQAMERERDACSSPRRTRPAGQLGSDA